MSIVPNSTTQKIFDYELNENKVLTEVDIQDIFLYCSQENTYTFDISSSTICKKLQFGNFKQVTVSNCRIGEGVSSSSTKYVVIHNCVITGELGIAYCIDTMFLDSVIYLTKLTIIKESISVRFENCLIIVDTDKIVISDVHKCEFTNCFFIFTESNHREVSIRDLRYDYSKNVIFSNCIFSSSSYEENKVVVTKLIRGKEPVTLVNTFVDSKLRFEVVLKYTM